MTRDPLAPELDALAAWQAYCRGPATDEPGDEAIVGGAWAAGTITPPPSREPPRAREPLEHARALIERARSIEPGVRE